MRALLLAWTLLGVLLIGLPATTASAASAVSVTPGVSTVVDAGKNLIEQVKYNGGAYCKWRKKCGWKRVCWWKHGYKQCGWKWRCHRWCQKVYKHHKKRHGIYLNVY